MYNWTRLRAKGSGVGAHPNTLASYILQPSCIWNLDATSYTSYVPHPTSHIPHPTSYVSHPTSYFPHPTSHLLHPASHILHPISHVPHPTSHTSHIPHPHVLRLTSYILQGRRCLPRRRRSEPSGQRSSPKCNATSEPEAHTHCMRAHGVHMCTCRRQHRAKYHPEAHTMHGCTLLVRMHAASPPWPSHPPLCLLACAQRSVII